MAGKKIVIIVGIVVGVLFLLCALGVGVFYLAIRSDRDQTTNDDLIYDDPYLEEDTGTESEEATETSESPANSDETEISEEIATISGSVSYPSEYIPLTMQVCAENTLTTEVYCAESLIEDSVYTYGYGYSIDVPAGGYYVYAIEPSLDPNYKAYYNEFVTCGLSYECESHDPILVTVLPGQTATEIDPIDWYAQ